MVFLSKPISPKVTRSLHLSRSYLVQDQGLNPDSALTMPGDGTITIASVWNTYHEAWRWNGSAFVPFKKWQTVALWKKGRFESEKVNGEGDFARSSRLCSIATARTVLDASKDAPQTDLAWPELDALPHGS